MNLIPSLSLLLGMTTCLVSVTPVAWAADGGVFKPSHIPSIVYVASPSALADGAKAFIQSVADRGIVFLSDKKGNLEAQKKSFRALLRDSFDLETIGRFALGKYWRVATPAQRAEYQRLFEKMVIDVYADRFSSYDGQVLVVSDAKAVGDNDVMVATQIVPKDGSEKINIDWRVRKGDAGFKVVDVVVEGVSMGVTQRSDFAAVIGRGDGNVSVLIDHLKNGGKKG